MAATALELVPLHACLQAGFPRAAAAPIGGRLRHPNSSACSAGVDDDLGVVTSPSQYRATEAGSEITRKELEIHVPCVI